MVGDRGKHPSSEMLQYTDTVVQKLPSVKLQMSRLIARCWPNIAIMLLL